MAFILTVIFCIFLLFIYFVPSFIAIGRRHTYVLQITLLNALLGWSFFGWAAALIWSTTNHLDEKINTKLSWIIVSVFAIAILFPVIFFFSIFNFYDVERIEMAKPYEIKKIKENGFYYHLTPKKIIKTEWDESFPDKEDKD